MLVAAISDTHLREPSPWLRRVFADHLEKADLLIHLGDMVGPALAEWFAANHPQFHAVAGNMDGWPVSENHPQQLFLKLEGVRLGAAHGWGSKSRVADNVYQAMGQDCDLVLYGHTHEFAWNVMGGVHVVNPGSLQEHAPSLALIEIEGPGAIRVEQVRPEAGEW